ncbi:MAG: ATP-grasp domain-containing protein [Treponema sp.]|nr:ATP-grasp domain-containing protein [Treponema sp.]
MKKSGNSPEKSVLLVLGAGIMQGPALRIAAEMGLKTVAADADPNAACIADAGRFENIDLKNKEGIEALARSLTESPAGGLGGIMTAGTDFSATVAWAASKLGLSSIPYEVALDASDKERMRGRFKACGVPSPEFIILNKVPDKGFSLPISLPVVVKPVDNMGSRGCRAVLNGDELGPAVKEALAFSRSGRVIVEEFMEGPEFSIDALVYKGEITICGFADRHIFFPPYFIEMGHTIPSKLNAIEAEPLLQAFKQGVKALGIENGAAKGDVKLTPKGPMIGEIAARLSGGYMSGWTFPYSSGVLVTKGAIEIAIGKKPVDLEPKWNMICAERAFISIPGKIRSVLGLESARVMPYVRDVLLRGGPGDTVNFPENNVSKCGNILSVAPEREDSIKSAEMAARSILIRLEPNNTATDEFLSPEPGKVSFPPDAFALSPTLLSALDALPDPGHRDPQSFCPFPGLTESGLKDYVGRSVEESLEAVRALTGLPLPVAADKTCEGTLGRPFWKALIRGGYQGAAYYIDSLEARQ